MNTTDDKMSATDNKTPKTGEPLAVNGEAEERNVQEQPDRNGSGQGTAAQGVSRLNDRRGETPSYQNGDGAIPSGYGSSGGMTGQAKKP